MGLPVVADDPEIAFERSDRGVAHRLASRPVRARAKAGDLARQSPRNKQDHAVLLLRLAGGTVDKLRLENPDRPLDAGGLRFVWLSGIAPDDSVATLRSIVLAGVGSVSRDAALFAIAVHHTPSALPALIGFTSPNIAPAIREKAAFWLANQGGTEGFATIQRLVREDVDAAFREKLAFDLTLVRQPEGLQPAALEELIRMAHADGSPQVRKQAQFWMANLGGKRVTADLRAAVAADPDRDVRRSAVFALSRLPSGEATTQLIEVAQTSNDPEVRKQAIFWLGQSTDPKALAYLTRLLQQ